MREKKSEYVKREKDVLNILSSAQTPFFVKLYCTFQDAERLYFVLSYAKNGELLQYISKLGNFDIACTRFYAGEIVLALEHLHRLGIIHRSVILNIYFIFFLNSYLSVIIIRKYKFN